MQEQRVKKNENRMNLANKLSRMGNGVFIIKFSALTSSLYWYVWNEQGISTNFKSFSLSFFLPNKQFITFSRFHYGALRSKFVYILPFAYGALQGKLCVHRTMHIMPFYSFVLVLSQ